jgi:hypothetical protein
VFIAPAGRGGGVGACAAFADTGSSTAINTVGSIRNSFFISIIFLFMVFADRQLNHRQEVDNVVMLRKRLEL